ncbi:MAG: DUF1592 domain-containing protein [Chitinophagaceae bacterium]|nr:DUF1592 domain-containing protein [Oligoflexus sp.]
MRLKRVLLLALFVFIASCDGRPLYRRNGWGSATTETGDVKPNSYDKSGTEVIGPDGKPIVATGKTAISLVARSAASSVPRLSHQQWENTVKDLLQLPALPGQSKNFPDDPRGSLFGNNGALLSVSANQWTAYRNAAEAMGILVGSDAMAYKKLIPTGQNDIISIVKTFLKKAYRHPPTDDEVAQMVALYTSGTKLTGLSNATGAGFAAMITAALQSPNFIYRIELGTTSDSKYAFLNTYEIASRLSYAVWNTMPDATLFALADNEELAKADVFKTQALRLMKDPRGAALLKNIHLQGYAVNQFEAVKQDAKIYPETAGFDTGTLRNEAELFVNDVIVTQGKGITELFTAPYAFVSSKTAAAYEVSAVSAEPKKIDLDPTRRAGLMSQVAFLSNYSKTGGLTAIIKRGHYVAETILCGTFEGAPPSVDNDTQSTFKTNRERINALTGSGSCAGCHTTKINPPGFAMESFGPGGKWRTTESSGAALDVSGSFLLGTDTVKFDGPVELMKEITATSELHQCYVKKLIEALYGRYADVGDSNLIEVLGMASKLGMAPRDLFLYILSDPMMKLQAK